MKLTTTLNRIRAHHPCTTGWKTLLKHLDKTDADDVEINLLTILESNGVQDMLWRLRTTVEDSKHIASQLAIEFAEQVLPIFEKHKPTDDRPHKAIQAARDFLDGKIGVAELRKAREAAYAAANVYASDADTDAYAAAADAVYYGGEAEYVVGREEARAKQVTIIRMILE